MRWDEVDQITHLCSNLFRLSREPPQSSDEADAWLSVDMIILTCAIISYVIPVSSLTPVLKAWRLLTISQSLYAGRAQYPRVFHCHRTGIGHSGPGHIPAAFSNARIHNAEARSSFSIQEGELSRRMISVYYFVSDLICPQKGGDPLSLALRGSGVSVRSIHALPLTQAQSCHLVCMSL